MGYCWTRKFPLHYKVLLQRVKLIRAIGALIVFDLTNEESFRNVDNWLAEVEENTSSSIIKILIGNKTDMVDK